uniref:Uncharacterized protein n=1 Tax=Candidatus Kentrum sp. LPFa TaxID=2126335 RepID=A0A450WG66_9GAMM|nr:MAG: hypothetical protein BECKLPF1236B_GA0070989_10877 [Candidatus Kentron sp. LPFa]
MENLTASLSLQEQLAFWERRTEIMLERQRKYGQRPVRRMDGTAAKQ